MKACWFKRFQPWAKLCQSPFSGLIFPQNKTGMLAKHTPCRPKYGHRDSIVSPSSLLAQAIPPLTARGKHPRNHTASPAAHVTGTSPPRLSPCLLHRCCSLSAPQPPPRHPALALHLKTTQCRSSWGDKRRNGIYHLGASDAQGTCGPAVPGQICSYHKDASTAADLKL